jgi:hypothetical protein
VDVPLEVDPNEAARPAVAKLTDRLQKRLAQYNPPSFAGKVTEEPVLEPPDVSRFVFQPTELHTPNEVPELPELSFEEIKAEVLDHALTTSVKWQRFNGKYQQTPIVVPELDGNAKCPESFEAQYEAADGPELFPLVGALLTNGFVGTSIAEVFGLSRGATKPAEVAAVVNSIGLGQLFGKINELLPAIEANYSPSAIIRDLRVVRELEGLPKVLEVPAELPVSFPFQFVFRPFKMIDDWFFRILYAYRIDAIDAKTIVFKLAEAMTEFFMNYLLAGKNFGDFLREWSATRTAPFSAVKNQTEFLTAWTKFWVGSYAEDRLLIAFLDFFNPKTLILQYYAPCAAARDVAGIRAVAEMLAFLPGLKLPKNVEIGAAEEKSIRKSLRSLIRWPI